MTSSFPWNQANVMVQDYIIPTIHDQIFLSNATFNRMKGRVKHFTGGRRIVVPLGWRTQGGIKWFAGTDVFTPTVRDPFQAAEFTPKNANVDITIDWDEEMTASGPEKVMDLMEAKGEWARSTFFDGMGNDIYNDGTDPRAMAGLQYALKEGATGTTDPPTMTYGGISRSATVNTWWNHISDNPTTAYVTGASSTFAGSASTGPNFNPVNRAFARVKLASGKAPTMILSNVGAWSEVHFNLVKNERYQRPQQQTDLFKAGFENFMFRSAVWVQDEKAPRTASTKIEKVYGLYEPSCRLWVDSRADFAFEPFRKPHNQMVRTAYILWRGEFIVSEPRANFVIANVDASGVS